MRSGAIIFVLLAIAGSGFASWVIADKGTEIVEDRTRAELNAALQAAGEDWAQVEVNGLSVTVSGEAVNEATRFGALELVRQSVDPRRIVDLTTIENPDPVEPPKFALELLRNEAEISMIGLVPTVSFGDGVTSDAIRETLEADGLAGNISDMLEMADHPAPDEWPDSLRFGLDVLSELPRAKISVTPGHVNVTAVADSPTAREELEVRLLEQTPDAVELYLDISSPRPVIAPFTVSYSFDGTTGRFQTCSAEDENGVAKILAAARETGLEGDAECAIGLGSPNAEWPEAVAEGLAALRGLGGGKFSITDTEALLAGPKDIDAQALTETGHALEEKLPDGLILTTIAPPNMAANADGVEVYSPQFDAVLLQEGHVRLAGAVRDETAKAAIHSYAAALFGHERVTDATVFDPELPDGWPVRVLAGLDALSGTTEGILKVTANDLVIEGWGLTEDVDATVEDLLRGRVERSTVNIRFNATAAAEQARSTGTSPESCVSQIAAILQNDSIGFRPGSAEITPQSSGIIAAVADVLRECPGAEFEVAGHTDNQGSTDGNLRLSEQRALAVRFALEDEDLPLIAFRARGYGATQPVADNATEAGRSRNRRIELSLYTGETPPAEAEVRVLDPEICATEVTDILSDATIQFGAGSSAIAEESMSVLESISGILRSCPGLAFEIGGHTDNQGSADINQRISQERAEAVVSALKSQGVEDVELTAKGYGADNPVADNGTREGRSLNRRIEFTLTGPDLETEAGDGEAMDGHDHPEAAIADETGCSAGIGALLARNSIGFQLGASAISGESRELVAEIGAELAECPEGSRFEIGGYTDDRGSAEGNLRLSEQRAQSVRDALQEMAPNAVLTARGYGENNPVADNDTREGRALNRRIEIRQTGAAEDPVAAQDPADTDNG